MEAALRILWHSAYPDTPTGYASQTALILPRLRDLGHEVALSCSYGVESYSTTWQGFKVYGKTPYADVGEDVVYGHYQDWKADLVVTFLCTWTLNPMAWRDMRVLHLCPVDAEGMSARDYGVVAATGGLPAAVSQWGVKQMRKRGLQPVYLPHGVDTAVMKPPDDRAALRKATGMDGKFVVGINFMNNDKFRKFIPEQVRAFAGFHGKHPDSLLALHAIARLPEGYNLPVMVKHFGIEKAVLFSDQYQLVTGGVTPEALAAWYGTCDVTMHCGNEGFGLTRVESQACGTPVITASWGTGPELLGAGWKVQGQLYYNDIHQTDWHQPFISSIRRGLESAYKYARQPGMRAKAREFALGWDIDTIVANHWKPVLDDLG